MSKPEKKMRVRRLIAEWRIETWEVGIPADTDPDECENVALDGMYDGNGEIIADEPDCYVEHMDSEILEVSEVTA